MSTKSRKNIGDEGEREVIAHVVCPNCNRELMLLPQSYPLYDVQCKGCFFRAQVKSTNGSKPHDMIRGAGWDIMDKVMKAGSLVPPLIVNFKWREEERERQEIRFYPFIKKSNLIKYMADIKSCQRVYKMFNYNLKGLKYYVVFEK